MADLMSTTGYNFEGYTIVDYLGVCSGECVLGTGFLSSLGAGLADFFGTNSEMYSGKLREAKEYALNQLYNAVRNLGGNAIIGIDIDYTTFSSDIMGVIASGTAVKIEKCWSKSVSTDIKFDINQTNLFTPFKTSSLTFYASDKETVISLNIVSKVPCNIEGIVADITVTTMFEEDLEYKNLHFISFHSDIPRHFSSSPISIALPPYALKCPKTISVMVRKYINNRVMCEVSDMNIQAPDTLNEPFYSLDDILEIIEPLKSVREIIDYFENHSENRLEPELLEELKNIMSNERIYGNMKDSAIRKIRNYFES